MWYPAVTQFFNVSVCHCSYTNQIHSSSGYSWYVLTQVFSLNLYTWHSHKQADSKQVRVVLIFFFNRIHRENLILFDRLVCSSGTSEPKSSIVYLHLCNYNYYFKSNNWSLRNILLVNAQHSASTKELIFLPLCPLILLAFVQFLL